MPYTSEFHGPIDGQFVIPGTHTAAGGTTNFHFGCPSAQGHPFRTREPFSTVPFAPDPDLVDRPAIAAWVRDKCAGPGARAALVGLGGVGKSQLALQYAHSIRDAAPQTFVLWVHASTRARFEEAYRDIADRLQLLGRDDPKTNVLQLVHDWLRDEANGRWVMVVDNVDNVETFFPSRKRQRQEDETDASTQIPLATFLPQSRNGAILVTSRSKDAAAKLAGGYNKIKEVPAMDEGEGLQLLRNKLRDSPLEESAVDLLHALDCIPLAVAQAAAYINRRGRMTVASYLAEFQRNSKKRESLLGWDAGELRRDESASNSVVTTWQMSFEQIQRERRSAAELLSLMSFFNPQGIPESVLRRHSREAAREAGLEDNEDADSAFDEDLDTLQAYSLVSMTAGSDAWEMHALVQFCTRVWLSSCSDAEQWEQRFVRLMAQELPSGKYENWAKCQQLLPHVEPLFDTQPASKEALEAWVQVLTNAAWYLCVRGNYEVAGLIAGKAFAATKRIFGTDNELTLRTINNLANILRDRGMYKDAESLHRRALEEREKRFGLYDRSTITSVNNLANALQIQGKYKEAEQLHQRALRWCEETLGSNDPITLTSMSNLAIVLRAQNLCGESESLHQRALEGRELILGLLHIDTLTSVSNLAVVTQYQGKYQKAEELYRRALEAKAQILVAQHPDVLTSVNNLATVLQLQGNFEEAEKLYRQALEGREKVLGVQHPDTLMSMSHLASVLQAQGRYEEAETLNRRALEGREKKLGEDHPDTLTSVSNLALIFRYQGRYGEAEMLNRRALEGREKKLGEDHPDTLTSVYCLAHLLHTLCQYPEAAKLYQRACDGYSQQLGSQHPQTVACRDDFAAMQQEVMQARSAQGEGLSPGSS